MWNPFKRKPKVDPITFHSIQAIEEGGVRVDLGWSPVLQFVVEAMKDLLEKKEAPNYVETILTDTKTGRQWSMLVRRVDGLSPATVNMNLKAMLREAETKLWKAEHYLGDEFRKEVLSFREEIREAVKPQPQA